jgi:periplasmic protein TonB
MNLTWNNATSDKRNDIVFEGRNQNYGAYQIRRSYNRTLTAVITGLVCFSASLFGLKSYIDNQPTVIEPPKKEYTNTPFDYTPDLPEKKMPPIELPPTAAPLAATTQFVPPVIDDNADENTRTQDDVNNTTVSNVTHDGDSTSVDPPIVGIPTGTGSGVTEIEGPETFIVVEEMPEFIGGTSAMAKFIQSNLQYPTDARELGLGGKCFLKFVVSGSGEISNVEVLKGVPGCAACDKEAIRVIKNMPHWKGGKQNGRPVNVYYNLPINFKVQ